MKKINKTVLLASSFLISQAFLLTDKTYASEEFKNDYKLDLKESIDSSDNSELITSENFTKVQTNTDQAAENQDAKPAESEIDTKNEPVANKPEEASISDGEISLENKQLVDDKASQAPSVDESQQADQSSDDLNQIFGQSPKKLANVIYYDNSDLSIPEVNKSEVSNEATNTIHNSQTQIEEKKYYAPSTSGYFVKNKGKINYFRNNKLVKNESIKVKDRIYRADKTGSLSNPRNSWLNVGKSIYYNGKDGSITKGITQIKDQKYYFDNDGVLQRNQKLVTQNTYYEVNRLGQMKTAPNKWVNINGAIYRTQNDGSIARGITKVGNADYMFDNSGKLQTNKKLILNDKYYTVNATGVVTNPKNEWLAIDGLTYRTDKDGKIVKNVQEINNNTYVFDHKTGVMITGKTALANGKFFEIDNRGVATNPKDAWVTHEGKTFHTNANGYIQKGIWDIEGKTYCFDGNGLVRNSKYLQNGIEYTTDDKGLARRTGFEVKGDKNIDTVMDWMFQAKNKNMTYNMGAGRNTETQADCSSAVYRALIYGGFLKSDAYVGNTETLFAMGAKGEVMYEIKENEIDYGDIFVAGNPGQSLGAGGHTGFILNKQNDSIIHMNYSDNGVRVTPRKGRMGDASGRPIRYYRLVGAKSSRIFVDKK